jgi:hypothetical protein
MLGCGEVAMAHVRATIPDFLNVGHTLQFPQSRLKLFGICVMCVAVTAALAGMGYDWMPNPLTDGRSERFRFMAPLFGLITLYPFYLLVNANKKGITLTRTGVADHRISSQEIPWLGIEAVREGRNVSSRFIVLQLADAKYTPESLLQSLESMALGLGESQRTISAGGLKVSHAMLVEAILAGWQSARHPRPAPATSRATTANSKGFGHRTSFGRN